VAASPSSDDAFFDAIRGEDQLGAVVRAHIHIEARLNQVVEALTPHPDELPSLRYEQRAKLAVALGLDGRILNPLLELGRIRNAFAHRLDVKLTDSMVAKLFEAFHKEDRWIIVDAYQRTWAHLGQRGMPPYEKTDARHKFITMAVAMDKFLLMAEREARVQAPANKSLEHSRGR
jgi:hypothetical protein